MTLVDVWMKQRTSQAMISPRIEPRLAQGTFLVGLSVFLTAVLEGSSTLDSKFFPLLLGQCLPRLAVGAIWGRC